MECEEAVAQDKPAKVVWGQMITYFREKGYAVLHSACGGLTDIEIIDNALVVNMDDEGIYNIMMSNMDRINEISNIVARMPIKINLLKKKINAELESAILKFGVQIK